MFDDLKESSFSLEDWAEVTKLKIAFEQGGQEGLVEALTALVHNNRDCYLNIMEVLNPGYKEWVGNLDAEREAAARLMREDEDKD